ncbi:recombination protein O N-terminal domain-containing protein, partial [Synechococcus sp.]
MAAAREREVTGLCLRAMALGEQDRLLTLLSAEEGLVRLAASGARKPSSSLAAASPLTHLRG